MTNSDSFPAAYHSVNPYILVRNAEEFAFFLESVFVANINKKIKNDKDVYFEAKIGDSIIMIGED